MNRVLECASYLDELSEIPIRAVRIAFDYISTFWKPDHNFHKVA